MMEIENNKPSRKENSVWEQEEREKNKLKSEAKAASERARARKREKSMMHNLIYFDNEHVSL